MKSEKKDRLLLEKCSLFSELDKEELGKLLEIASDRVFYKSELIFSEGDEAEGFYVLSSGKVKIFKLSQDGREQILHIISPGEAFAEAALFSGERYPAFAEALKNSSVFFFSKKKFLLLIKKNPQLAMNIIATLSRRLRDFSRMIEELSLMEVSSRLARYLIDESVEDNGETVTDLKISKTHLASRLGTISETLSRTLASMKSKGMIDVKGNTVTIKKMDLLEDLAAGIKR